MLVLSRKVNEEIIIGDNIRVTVVRVEGNRIRLGISAPAEISIRRQELSVPGIDEIVEVGHCERPQFVECC